MKTGKAIVYFYGGTKPAYHCGHFDQLTFNLPIASSFPLFNGVTLFMNFRLLFEIFMLTGTDAHGLQLGPTQHCKLVKICP